MKILIFTEGTALTFKSEKGLSREKQVRQSHLEGIQREEASLSYNSVEEVPEGKILFMIMQTMFQ